MQNKPNNIFLSIVIPCYNEEKRIKAGLTQTLTFLRKQKYTWEIVLVDDGSKDKTQAFARQILKGFTYQLLTLPRNSGKGRAIKAGIEAARGKYIIFTDIDLSTPIDETVKLLSRLKTYDIAIGIRRHPKARVIRHQPLVREALGQVFTVLTNVLVTRGIYDVTCGFKGFRRVAAKSLFGLSCLNAWAFDAEILYLARKYGFRIAQIPVTWSDNRATKVHIFKDGLLALGDLFSIRWRDLRGKYPKEIPHQTGGKG